MTPDTVASDDSCAPSGEQEPAQRVAVMLSVKPVYVDMILAGSKTVELRRVFRQQRDSIDAYIYASSPRQHLIATATIERVEVDTPDVVWRRFGHLAGVERPVFDAYFSGARSASALQLANVRSLAKPVTLARLRELECPPPQSYRYMRADGSLLRELEGS